MVTESKIVDWDPESERAPWPKPGVRYRWLAAVREAGFLAAAALFWTARTVARAGQAGRSGGGRWRGGCLGGLALPE